MSDLIINESNFGEYFFDVRLHKPQPGQVMATYTAAGELLDGPEKRQIIEFLQHTDKVVAAVQVMRKALLAKDPDTYLVPKRIAQDLLDGKTVEEVARYPHKFVMEASFWTKVEYIPVDDPHWACVSILNLNEHFAKKEALEANEEIQVKSRIVGPNDESKAILSQ